MPHLSSLNLSRLALVISCLLALVIQGHTLLRPMLITDDIAQHHVWLDAGEGSGFLPDDPWISTAKVIQPYVSAAVFSSVRLLLPTLLVGKVIALLLLALTGWLVYRIGQCLGGARLGWIALGLFFISDAWIGLSGGFARSFAWPIVCGFLLALLNGRRGWAALCLFLAAALYPIAFVLLAPAYVLVWLSNQSRHGWRSLYNLRLHLQNHWPVLLAVVAGSTLVLLKSSEISHHPFVGPQVTLAQIQQDPLYGVGGRVPLWPQTPIQAMLPWTLLPWNKTVIEPLTRHLPTLPASVSQGFTVAWQLAALLGVVLALFLVSRRSRGHALVLLALALSGCLTFCLAELLLPRLFESSRYLVWSMPVLAVLSWAVLLDAVFALVPPGRLRPAAFVLLALILASRVPSIRGKGAEDVSEYTALYTQLARTGGGEVIACFPRTGDFIPVLCHRSVFISNESAHAVLFTRYRELVMSRQTAQLKAFYSAKAEDVRTFCQQHNISWLVVEEKYYRPDMEPGLIFAPFEQELRDMLKQTPQPWLLTYARKSGKQVQPGVYLCNTGPILDSTAQP
ncbi:MAG: hypothetical protein K9N47_14560 [Prosthecobacter sp.]|uniref:hypothetical protein n=1 Tax=Prosthecobacter sp. TaxID=1965333 RepID=UPI0025E2158C|nr:hypothetical protein [Prosthecobacter sp.]MCF7787347.1 hypothetical protein [Prosthecobacter sp.]